MSIHIVTQKGEIAETVLLCGDPLRAKHIAETYFTDAKCYNQVRGMLGYTGTYQGKRLSVQAVGMGMPSMSIYAHELIVDFGVKNLIRIGTAGALQPHVKLRSVVMALSASTDSNMNHLTFNGKDFAPTANFDLLRAAVAAAEHKKIAVEVGNVLTSDTFYDDHPDGWKLFARYGTLAVEMEVAALYTTAAKHGCKALAMVTISDHLVTGERVPASERQSAFNQMVEVALEVSRVE